MFIEYMRGEKKKKNDIATTTSPEFDTPTSVARSSGGRKVRRALRRAGGKATRYIRQARWRWHGREHHCLCSPYNCCNDARRPKGLDANITELHTLPSSCSWLTGTFHSTPAYEFRGYFQMPGISPKSTEATAEGWRHCVLAAGTRKYQPRPEWRPAIHRKTERSSYK